MVKVKHEGMYIHGKTFYTTISATVVSVIIIMLLLSYAIGQLYTFGGKDGITKYFTKTIDFLGEEEESVMRRWFGMDEAMYKGVEPETGMELIED